MDLYAKYSGVLAVIGIGLIGGAVFLAFIFVAQMVLNMDEDK